MPIASSTFDYLTSQSLQHTCQPNDVAGGRQRILSEDDNINNNRISDEEDEQVPERVHSVESADVVKTLELRSNDVKLAVLEEVNVGMMPMYDDAYDLVASFGHRLVIFDLLRHATNVVYRNVMFQYVCVSGHVRGMLIE